MDLTTARFLQFDFHDTILLQNRIAKKEKCMDIFSLCSSDFYAFCGDIAGVDTIYC